MTLQQLKDQLDTLLINGADPDMPVARLDGEYGPTNSSAEKSGVEGCGVRTNGDIDGWHDTQADVDMHNSYLDTDEQDQRQTYQLIFVLR